MEIIYCIITIIQEYQLERAESIKSIMIGSDRRIFEKTMIEIEEQ